MGNNAILALIPIYLFTFMVVALNGSTDEYTLLAFKSQISNPSKILATNWSRGTSFCNWIGITCGRRHPRVTGLNLANMSLEGTIARDIGNLSFLRSFVISYNNFHGFIPYEMGNLSRLREIDMRYNDLHGPIPTSFGFLKNLLKLTLLSNVLNGHIPNQIFNLSRLVRIDFSNNSLSGGIPTDIGNNLPNLEKLGIAKNRIGGSIPPSLGRCRKLKMISLSFNNLGGSIPLEIGNLSELQDLYLSENHLIGTSACPAGKFYCRNTGSTPRFLFSSHVNDKICDCCDGSDEYDGTVICLNTCVMGGNVAYQTINYGSLASRARSGDSTKPKPKINIENSMQKLIGLKVLVFLQLAIVVVVVAFQLIRRRKTRRRYSH